MLQSIPPKRLLTYLLIIGWIPVVLVFLQHAATSRHLQNMQGELNAHLNAFTLVARKQKSNLSTYNTFRGANPHWVDQHLEKLTFLEAEINSLQETLMQDNLLDLDPLQKRLQFLTSDENHLAFRESAVEELPRCREVLEQLLHPVEVSGQDVEKILAHIEGTAFPNFPDLAPGRPHMLITDFRLERKLQKQQEVYILDMKCIKREYL